MLFNIQEDLNIIHLTLESYILPLSILPSLSFYYFQTLVWYNIIFSYWSLLNLKSVMLFLQAWGLDSIQASEDLFSRIVYFDVNSFSLECWLRGSTVYQNFFFLAYPCCRDWWVDELCTLGIPTLFVSKVSNITSIALNAYWVSALFVGVLYGVVIVIFLTSLLYSRYNINIISSATTQISSKFFMLFESEEELGALADIISFITIFIVLFGWYFLGTFFFSSFFTSSSLSFMVTGFYMCTVCVLCIPLSMWFDYGLFFTTYVRGAGNTKNILVEVIFDLISTLVIFVRFFIQNIRFVLIFGVYFELYHFIYESPTSYLFYSFLGLREGIYSTFTLMLTEYNFFYTLSLVCTSLFMYFYYFIHLMLVMFTQMGAYFLISFWLFFFFYTSFILNNAERFFMFKRCL